MSNGENAGQAMGVPSVSMMGGVSRDEVTIEPDGTHTGPAVKRIDIDTEEVTVYCPCGHYVASLSVALRNSYYNGTVTCEESLSGFSQ